MAWRDYAAVAERVLSTLPPRQREFFTHLQDVTICNHVPVHYVSYFVLESYLLEFENLHGIPSKVIEEHFFSEIVPQYRRRVDDNIPTEVKKRTSFHSSLLPILSAAVDQTFGSVYDQVLNKLE